MTPEELRRHPKNPRIHSAEQKAAMRAMLDQVGFVGAVMVNERTGLMLDGHMRSDLADDGQPIPVLFVDLDEKEEAEVLALSDPIGAMADYDRDLLADLTDDLDLDGPLGAALDGLLPDDEAEPSPPKLIELEPLSKAYVLVTVPLDQWGDVSDVLEQLSEFEDVAIYSTVK